MPRKPKMIKPIRGKPEEIADAIFRGAKPPEKKPEPVVEAPSPKPEPAKPAPPEKKPEPVPPPAEPAWEPAPAVFELPTQEPVPLGTPPAAQPVGAARAASGEGNAVSESSDEPPSPVWPVVIFILLLLGAGAFLHFVVLAR